MTRPELGVRADSAGVMSSGQMRTRKQDEVFNAPTVEYRVELKEREMKEI